MTGSAGRSIMARSISITTMSTTRAGRRRSPYAYRRDLASGPYALHVSCGASDETATREDYLAFFVRPPRGRKARKGRPGSCPSRADRLVHRLCQSRRAHHRARRRIADEPAPALRALGPLSLRPSRARRIALRLPCRRLRRLLFEPAQAGPQLLRPLSFLARRTRLGTLPIQCRHAPLRLARSQGRRL